MIPKVILKDEVIGKIKDLIKALEKQEPDPLGDLTQCLAAAQIEALESVIGIIEKSSEMKEKKTISKKMEIERQQGDISEYVGNISEKLVDAAEDVFGSTEPKPTGNDMIDAISLASVFLFSNQIRLSCNSKKTMQSVLKSTVWALKARIDTFAAPLLEDENAWEEYFGKREEEDKNEQG